MNCVTFVCDWVNDVSGVDPIAIYRGTVETKEQAMAQLGGDLLTSLIEVFGPSIHPVKAQRGDIVYRSAEDACGILFTSGARMNALFLGEGGFTMHRATNCDHAFRVTDRCVGWQRKLNEYILAAQERYIADGFSWTV